MKMAKASVSKTVLDSISTTSRASPLAPNTSSNSAQTILNLAVRGKLVPQDPKDEAVASLIAQINAERKFQANAGESISDQNAHRFFPLSFSNSQSWVWERLGFLTNVVMGQSPPGDTTHARGMDAPC